MVEDEFPIFCMGVLVKVVNSRRVKERGTTFYSVNDVTFVQQEFCQIGAILPRNPSYECNLCHYKPPNSSYNVRTEKLTTQIVRESAIVLLNQSLKSMSIRLHRLWSKKYFAALLTRRLKTDLHSELPAPMREFPFWEQTKSNEK